LVDNFSGGELTVLQLLQDKLHTIIDLHVPLHIRGSKNGYTPDIWQQPPALHDENISAG
jgi:hypothetical protein